jgi:hypothetical protein
MIAPVILCTTPMIDRQITTPVVAKWTGELDPVTMSREFKRLPRVQTAAD